MLQSIEGEAWVDLYGFPAQPVPLIDVETINWWTSTHPRSPFVSGLIVSRLDADGARTSLSDRGELALTERTPSEVRRTAIARDAVPELLATRFALDGFKLDAAGRLALA